MKPGTKIERAIRESNPRLLCVADIRVIKELAKHYPDLPAAIVLLPEFLRALDNPLQL